MTRKLLKTKHDQGTRFSVVLILKKFLKASMANRKAKWNQKKATRKNRILSISNYVILFEQTTKLSVLNN